MDFVEKTNWQDAPSTATPITSAELLRIEAGVAEGARNATETLPGNVELATPAEMSTGTDTTRVPAVERVKTYVAAQIAAAVASIPGASPASETVSGVVELASTAEMTTGTDTARVPAVSKVAAYVAAQVAAGIASIPGASAASETVSGVVELASTAEMTTGTDTGRVPAVSKVAAYVASAVAAIPGVATSSETVSGIVELASTAEMNTGTDTGRVPAVAKVAAYVTAAISASATTINASITSLANSTSTSLGGKADKTGSIRQFADVADTAFSDLNVLQFDSGTGALTGTDLGDVYATKGSDGRLDPTENPVDYVPLKILNEGDPVPSSFPAGGIVFVRHATPTLVPTLIGINDNGGSTTVVVTTTQDAEVGDTLVLSLAVSDEVTSNQTLTSVTPSAGAATYVSIQTQQQSGTIKAFLGYARVTTRIPSGSTITWTVSASRTHLMASVARVSNLASSSVLDGNAGGGATSSTSATGKTVASITTTNPNDVGLMLVGYNSGTLTGGTGGVSNVRTIAGTNGWISVTGQVQHVGASSNRAHELFYRVLSTAQNPLAGTIQFTAADASTGSWAGAVAALKSV